MKLEHKLHIRVVFDVLRCDAFLVLSESMNFLLFIMFRVRQVHMESIV